MSDNLSGISLADRHFGIGVGDNGSIVHFVDDDAGTLMPSGTNFPLLDVYVLDAQNAVAAGKDIVLLWDGSDWVSIRENVPPQEQFFSPVWMTPERDLVLYGTLGQSFNFICPYEPGAAQQGFCRGFGPSTLTMCGHSNDIKIVLTDGAIWWLDNTLNNPADPLDIDPMFDPPTPLDLKAAWIAPTACIEGAIPPQDIFAIDDGNRFWRFDGTAWTQMPDTIDTDHTLNWLGGTGGGNVLAVGSRPSMTPGATEGIAWRFDGSSWSQEALPPGTPGLADVAMTLSQEFGIFGNGFEDGVVSLKASDPSLMSWIKAIGDAAATAHLRNALFGAVADLRVDESILTLPPYTIGQTVEINTLVRNAGPDLAPLPQLVVVPQGMIHVSDDCSSVGVGSPGAPNFLVALNALAPGAEQSCNFRFQITSSLAAQVEGVYDFTTSDPEPRNNLDSPPLYHATDP